MISAYGFSDQPSNKIGLSCFLTNKTTLNGRSKATVQKAGSRFCTDGDYGLRIMKNGMVKENKKKLQH